MLRRALVLALLAAAADAGEYTAAEGGALLAKFGVYDMAVSPGDGWKLMTHQDFTKYGAAFRQQLNERGMPVIRPFRAGNCCVEWAVPR